MSRTVQLSKFNEFASEVWGNPNAVIKHHVGDGSADSEFDYIDLGRYFAAFRAFFVGALRVDKILIRQEYRDALKELEKDIYYNGACVLGHPGIGKTLFNIYILVTRLGEGRAVALQFMTGTGQPMYALFQHRVSFHSLEETDPLYDPPFVWALCDSNHIMEQPGSSLYGQQDQIRIIQTTSPKVSRWKEWTKQQGGKLYVMDIWSENEIRQLGTMLGQDVDRMVDLARKWGNIPRMVLENLELSDKVIERAYRKRAGRAVGDTPQFMKASVENFPSDAPSTFFFVRPSSDDGGVSRREFDVYVPTKTLWLFLGQALRGLDNQIRLAFYHVLSQHNQARTTAGNIYESWFHSFIVARKEISCTWLPQGDAKLSATWKMPVPDIHHESLIPNTLDALNTGVPPYYWVAPDRFPGIDGLLVLETGICAFQVTISSKHCSPENGLKKIRPKLRTDLKELPLGVVFVGPLEGAIVEAAQEWQGRIHLPAGEAIPVAWSVVDPASSNVEYTPFRDVEYEREFEEPEVVEQAEQLGDQTGPEDRAVAPATRSVVRSMKDKDGQLRDQTGQEDQAVMPAKRSSKKSTKDEPEGKGKQCKIE